MGYWDQMWSWLNRLTANEVAFFSVVFAAVLAGVGYVLKEIWESRRSRSTHIAEPTVEERRADALKAVGLSYGGGHFQAEYAEQLVAGEPTIKPMVRPYELKKGKYGDETLHLVNDSPARAYQVSLRFAFGSHVVYFQDRLGVPIPLLRPNEELKLPLDTRLKRPGGLVKIEWRVYSAIEEFEIAAGQVREGIAIPFSIQYHDGADRWYRTDCFCRRNVHVGFQIEVLRQVEITKEAAASPVEPFRADASLNPASETQQPVPVKVFLDLNLGGTPGLHVKLLNKSAETLLGVELQIENIHRWDDELREWVTSREIHDSGSAFRKITWGKVTLHPNHPEAIGFIRGDGGRLEVTGQSDGGQHDHRFRTAGIWRFSYRVIVPEKQDKIGSVCLSWTQTVAVPLDCPEAKSARLNKNS